MRFVIILAALLGAYNAHAAAKWTYDGQENGQGDWSKLDPAYAKCNVGNEQSPISIGQTSVETLPIIQFDYKPSDTIFTLDRYTIVSTPKQAQIYKEDGEIAALKEMLVRSPSEHDVLEKFYPIELQFIHENADKKITIVSVFVTLGQPNAAIQSLIDHFPVDVNTASTAALDWAAFLPAKRSYFAYNGSLSYPPCTEGIKIRVLKTPIEASEEQLRALTNKIGRNARAAQAIMMRTIQQSKE